MNGNEYGYGYGREIIGAGYVMWLSRARIVGMAM